MIEISRKRSSNEIKLKCNFDLNGKKRSFNSIQRWYLRDQFFAYYNKKTKSKTNKQCCAISPSRSRPWSLPLAPPGTFHHTFAQLKNARKMVKPSLYSKMKRTNPNMKDNASRHMTIVTQLLTTSRITLREKGTIGRWPTWESGIDWEMNASVYFGDRLLTLRMWSGT